MKALLFNSVLITTTAALRLADCWLWPQLQIVHRLEGVREWARLKLDNRSKGGRRDDD